MNYETFMEINEQRKREKFNLFQDELRKSFVRDIEGTNKVYTRDKNKFNLKVCSLKSGSFAVVKDGKDILFKNDDIHLCKVEWIMLTQDISLANKLF